MGTWNELPEEIAEVGTIIMLKIKFGQVQANGTSSDRPLGQHGGVVLKGCFCAV